MQREFEKVGVWQLMNKDIAAEKYTRKGDPLKLDCGYSPNGTIKLFHALAIETDPNSAKVLAFSFPRLAEGIAKLENKQAELTAIASDDLPRHDEAIAFSLDTLQQQQIKVAHLSDLSAIANTAARELGLM
jgi:hypothetical protein